MNQKGFAPIAIILIIIGALALGGGVWYMKEKKKTEEIRKQTEEIDQTQSSAQQQNQQTIHTEERLSINKIKIDDHVGDFIVKSIHRYAIPVSDFSIDFSGETTLEGMYYINEALGNALCINVDEDSKRKIPRLQEDYRNSSFCFRNELFVKQEFSSRGINSVSKVKISIKNYQVNFVSKGASDIADLVRVIE